MDIKNYINYNPSWARERDEIKELEKFDKIINAIYSIDECADVCFKDGLFHASYNMYERWFVIGENPNNTFTLQEKLANDIIYIVDGCEYQGTIAKEIKLACL